MNKFIAIVKKECKDNLRDRRALFSALAPAFFAPVFLVGMITFMLDKLRGDSDDPIEFSVIGAHHAPGLMNHISSQKTVVKKLKAEKSAQELVKSGEEKVVLVFKSDYQERFKKGQQNTVKIVYEGGLQLDHFSMSLNTFYQVRQALFTRHV